MLPQSTAMRKVTNSYSPGRSAGVGFASSAAPWGCPMRILFTLLAVALVAPTNLRAHGGGLDANGCHTNRKTGDYHCHRSAAPAAATRSSFAPLAPANELAPRSNVRPGSSASQPYANCTAARAAGAAPVRRGDPGYGTHLDRDGDGIGCE
jgi:hypothetical protein